MENFEGNYAQEMVSKDFVLYTLFCINLHEFPVFRLVVLSELVSNTDIQCCLQERKSQLEQDIVMVMEHMSRVSSCFILHVFCRKRTNQLNPHHSDERSLSKMT